MEELVLSGHSFGGSTMIEAANQLRESPPKALLLLDPWCYPIHKDILDGSVRLSCPVQMLHSEYFHGTLPLKHFDSWGCIQTLLKHSTSKAKENLIVNRIGHRVQTDFAIVAS